jgi:thioredoxin reductase
MNEISCDVAIIGAGTAGLAAERAARETGVKTLLIDDRFAGTTCATVGCMPSKLLLAAANAAHHVRKSCAFGIRTASPTIDGTAVMDRLRKERDDFIADTVKTIEQIPPRNRVGGRARFVDPTTLLLDNGYKILSKAIVVATGARPSLPKMFEALGDLVLTNETIFELRVLPRSVAVVGAGPLGLELAQALVRLDVDTAVFEQSDHLAALHDAVVAEELKSILSAEFPIRFGVKLDVTRTGKAARVSWSGRSTTSFDRVLVATGRPPQLKGLNLPSTASRWTSVAYRSLILRRCSVKTPRFSWPETSMGNVPSFTKRPCKALSRGGTRPPFPRFVQVSAPFPCRSCLPIRPWPRSVGRRRIRRSLALDLTIIRVARRLTRAPLGLSASIRMAQAVRSPGPYSSGLRWITSPFIGLGR